MPALPRGTYAPCSSGPKKSDSVSLATSVRVDVSANAVSQQVNPRVTGWRRTHQAEGRGSKWWATGHLESLGGGGMATHPLRKRPPRRRSVVILLLLLSSERQWATPTPPCPPGSGSLPCQIVLRCVLLACTVVVHHVVTMGSLGQVHPTRSSFHSCGRFPGSDAA